MNFREIQDDVILDRFNETQREAIKNAINSRYGRVWALEPWSFKRTQIPHVFEQGEAQVALSELGLAKVEAVFFPSAGSISVSSLTSERPELFNDVYTSRLSANPANFTVRDNSLFINPGASGNVYVEILGHLKWVPLSDDDDVPLIPAEYHYALVQGAAADILLRESDPAWQGEEKGFTDQVNEMRLSYMSNLPMARSAYPSWPY